MCCLFGTLKAASEQVLQTLVAIYIVRLRSVFHVRWNLHQHDKKPTAIKGKSRLHFSLQLNKIFILINKKIFIIYATHKFHTNAAQLLTNLLLSHMPIIIIDLIEIVILFP